MKKILLLFFLPLNFLLISCASNTMSYSSCVSKNIDNLKLCRHLLVDRKISKSSAVVIIKTKNSITLKYPTNNIHSLIGKEEALEWCKSNGYESVKTSNWFWIKKNKIIQTTFECTNSVKNSYFTDKELKVLTDKEIEDKKKRKVRLKKEKKRKARKVKDDKRKIELDKARKTCLDLGFKKGTKKYKNCLVELL